MSLEDPTQPIDETQLVTQELITTLKSINESLVALTGELSYFGSDLATYLKAINDELSYRNKHLG